MNTIGWNPYQEYSEPYRAGYNQYAPPYYPQDAYYGNSYYPPATYCPPPVYCPPRRSSGWDLLAAGLIGLTAGAVSSSLLWPGWRGCGMPFYSPWNFYGCGGGFPFGYWGGFPSRCGGFPFFGC